MSGPKLAGSLVSDANNFLDTKESKVNFAVPSSSILNENSDVPSKIYPGIMNISSIADAYKGKVLKLGIDGKKISRGRGKDMGDVDCWGFEESPTLKERKERIKIEEEACNKLDEFIAEIERNGFDNLKDCTDETNLEFIKWAQKEITTIGLRLKDLRFQKLSLKRAFDKFIKMAGDDWRNSRYMPVLSSIRTTQYDVELQLNNGLQLVQELAYMISVLNKADYSLSNATDLHSNDHFMPLTENKCNNIEQQKQYTASKVQILNIKQRSQQWFDIREKALATGSTLANAIGLNGLKKQQEHYDKVFLNLPATEFSAEQKENMEFGLRHEQDAIATTVTRVMPVFYPSLIFQEESCAVMENNNQKPMLVVSPDGTLRNTKHEPAMAFEAKCKPPNEQSTEVYYKIPWYYVTQILAEMAAYNTNDLLFTCWSPHSTVAMIAKYDDSLFQACVSELNDVLGGENVKRPTRTRTNVLELKQRIKEYTETSVEFIAEFPSVYASNTADTKPMTEESLQVVTLENISRVSRWLSKWLTNSYELSRKMATEILVFMINDTDRSFKLEISNAHPIAYAMKGPSMNVDTFRKMTDTLITECEKNGLAIVAISTDGQWHNYGVRDKDGHPLTLIQLQKDVWKEAKGQTKAQLLSWLKTTIAQGIKINMRKDHIEDLLIGKKRHKTVDENKSSEENNKLQQPNPTCVVDDNGSCPTEEYSFDVIRDISEKDAFIDNDIIQSIHYNSTECTIRQPSIGILNSLHEAFATLYAFEDETIIHEDSGDVMEENQNFINSSRDLPEEDIASDDKNASEPTMSESVRFTVAGDNKESCLNDKDLELMLHTLQHDKKACSKKSWTNVSFSQFKCNFVSQDAITSNFDRYCLRLCIQAVIGKLRKNVLMKFTLSSPKYCHVEVICKAMNLPHSNREKQSKVLKSPPTLFNICFETITKFPKYILAALKAENQWAEKCAMWICEKNCFTEKCEIFGLVDLIDWTSKPILGIDGHYRFHFTDSCHLLTCLRSKVCVHGISQAGVSKTAFEDAAASEETNLSIPIVTDCIDKQSVEFAKRVFEKDVECYLEDKGHYNEAAFCKLIREWFESEDQPAIPAIERCDRRMKLRKWLLEGVNFGHFPPYGRYIKGIPTVTFEGFLTNIERKMQIHSFVPNNAYNPRSLGSQEVEQLFSTFRDLDPSGLGTPKPDDIPRMVGCAVELDNFKLDPNR